MVRIAALNGRSAHNGHNNNNQEHDPDRDRKLRYAFFGIVLLIVLFRPGGSTISTVQDATPRPLTTTSARRPVYNTAVEAAATVNRFANDNGNETALPNLDLMDVKEQSKRENGMEMRFSNETFVMEWRAEQAAKRARQPVRNIDWSQVDCIDSTEAWQKCDLSDDRWGVSVVFISFGRSGSSITWETMSNLASERGQPAREDIGGSSKSASKELDAIKRKEHGKCWLERILCRREYLSLSLLAIHSMPARWIVSTHTIVFRLVFVVDPMNEMIDSSSSDQYNNRVAIQNGEGKAEIIGTKWKPFLRAFNHTKSREALEWLAGNPYIKVVYNERNFLDGTCRVVTFA